MIKGKKSLKIVLKYIIIYFSLIILFTGSLFLVSLISRKYLYENVKDSYNAVRTSRLYEARGIKSFLMDLYTDVLMINTSYSVDSSHPFESAILARRSYNPEKDVPELGYKFNEDENYKEYPIKELKNTLLNNNSHYFQYARYWHGYLVYLRPMLLIFNYYQIKIALTICLLAIGLLTTYFVFKKVGILEGILFIIGLIAFGFQYSGFSITYFATTIIFMGSTIFVLNTKKKIKPYVFFIIGAITSFFDLLTVPLLTLGVPLLMVISKKEKDDNNISIKDIILYCLNWSIGYLGLWLSKWVLTDLIYNKMIVKDAIFSVLERTSLKKYSLFDVLIKNNIKVIIEMFTTILITMISFIIYIIKYNELDIKIKRILIYLFIAVMPIGWYIVTQNHSYIHSRFTYKILFITFIALLFMDVKIIKNALRRK